MYEINISSQSDARRNHIPARQRWIGLLSRVSREGVLLTAARFGGPRSRIEHAAALPRVRTAYLIQEWKLRAVGREDILVGEIALHPSEGGLTAPDLDDGDAGGRADQRQSLPWIHFGRCTSPKDPPACPSCPACSPRTSPGSLLAWP
jgi:hypothetical protein